MIRSLSSAFISNGTQSLRHFGSQKLQATVIKESRTNIEIKTPKGTIQFDPSTVDMNGFETVVTVDNVTISKTRREILVSLDLDHYIPATA